MTFDTRFRPKLAAIAAVCLLSVALPSSAILAKEKIKTPHAQTSAPANASATAPEVSVDIAAINAVGANIDDATLRAIFSGAIADNADALASLSASKITIPNIIIKVSTNVDGAPKSGTLTLKEIVLDNVEDGVAASITLGGIGLTTNDNVSGSFGKASASNVDIGGLLGLYGLVDPGDQTEMSTLYSAFTFEGGTMAIEDVACHIGSMDGGEVKARPLKYSFSDIMAMADAMEAQGETPSPELIGMALHIYADIFTAFQSTPVTFGGFDCKGTDEDGQKLDFSIADMTMGGMSPGIYPSIAMNGFKVAADGDGQVNIGSLVFKAMDLSGPIATVEAAPAAIDQAWLDANMRLLIPAFAGFSISDLNVDIPNPEAAGERIKASIGAYDLTLADYVNGIPTNLSTTASKIVADLPTNSGDEQINQLVALGIKSVDFGFAVKAAWDQATNAINIEDISIDGVDLARIGLSGTIGNATKALFDADPNAALVAAMGLVVNDIKLDVRDAGLSDIVMAAVSAGQGADAAAMRPVYAGLAEGTIVGMLAGAAQAQNVGKAVSAFITGDAKNLSIEMTAKDPAGLGLADFMAAEDDPTLLIGKTNITASAK